ncbi:hypothetical protein ACFQZC_29570 [Streptacidiphilus monticola]
MTLDDAWPGIIDATETAMRTVMPAYRTGRAQRTGCTVVKSYSVHWTCLFPQHGPGLKSSRRIALQPWQHQIVGAHPWACCAASSTPTAAASPTGPSSGASATSTRGTSSPTSPTTSGRSSAMPWTPSGWPGV